MIKLFFRTHSPPPLTRKLSREALEAHDQILSKDSSPTPNDPIVPGGLSRTSALNNRYFDDKANKSRSLDNLMDAPADMNVRYVPVLYPLM